MTVQIERYNEPHKPCNINKILTHNLFSENEAKHITKFVLEEPCVYP